MFVFAKRTCLFKNILFRIYILSQRPNIIINQKNFFFCLLKTVIKRRKKKSQNLQESKKKKNSNTKQKLFDLTFEYFWHFVIRSSLNISIRLLFEQAKPSIYPIHHPYKASEFFWSDYFVFLQRKFILFIIIIILESYPAELIQFFHTYNDIETKNEKNKSDHHLYVALFINIDRFGCLSFTIYHYYFTKINLLTMLLLLSN